jgi:hypothetical protein
MEHIKDPVFEKAIHDFNLACLEFEIAIERQLFSLAEEYRKIGRQIAECIKPFLQKLIQQFRHVRQVKYHNKAKIKNLIALLRSPAKTAYRHTTVKNLNIKQFRTPCVHSIALM